MGGGSGESGEFLGKPVLAVLKRCPPLQVRLPSTYFSPDPTVWDLDKRHRNTPPRIKCTNHKEHHPATPDKQLHP